MNTATRGLTDPLEAGYMNDPTSTSENNPRRGPFAVDTDRALDALVLAWGDDYDAISLGHDGLWHAHLRHARLAHLAHADEDDCDDACPVITGSTPDELNRAIRADQERRAAL